MTTLSPIQTSPISPILNTDPKYEVLDDRNFILRVQDLVLRILEQLGKFSEKDRTHVDTLKKEFREASVEMSNLQIRIGNSAPWISGIALATAASQFLAPQDMSSVIQLLAGQVPNIGTVYTSHLQADQTGVQSISSLRQTEIANQSQKGQSEAEVKSAILGLLNSLLEVLKKASS